MHATELIQQARKFAQEGFRKAERAEDVANFALVCWKLDKAERLVRDAEETIRALHETGYIAQCKDCGEWHHHDWLTDGLCDDCLVSTPCSACCGTGDSPAYDPTGPYAIPCHGCGGTGKAK